MGPRRIAAGVRVSTRHRPVSLSQITPAMLAPVQRVADRSRLPQTVWPSRWFGPEYQGEDCALTSVAAPGLDLAAGRPSDAADGCAPIMSILPAGWLR